jgi:hypothetical protein
LGDVDVVSGHVGATEAEKSAVGDGNSQVLIDRGPVKRGISGFQPMVNTPSSRVPPPQALRLANNGQASKNAKSFFMLITSSGMKKAALIIYQCRLSRNGDN